MTPLTELSSLGCLSLSFTLCLCCLPGSPPTCFSCPFEGRLWGPKGRQVWQRCHLPLLAWAAWPPRLPGWAAPLMLPSTRLDRLRFSVPRFLYLLNEGWVGAFHLFPEYLRLHRRRGAVALDASALRSVCHMAPPAHKLFTNAAPATFSVHPHAEESPHSPTWGLQPEPWTHRALPSLPVASSQL